MTIFDPLDSFMQWFWTTPPIGFIPFKDPISKIEDVISLLWYRSKPFQVQLFLVPPNYIIPEHTHPNVDSYEIYLGGNIRFSHSGNYANPIEDMVPLPDGTCHIRGRIVRVRPNDVHGGVSGPEGGVFMSVQYWLNGIEPHCVAADYDGIVMGPDHLAKVKHGFAILKEDLSPKDAASNE
jgi:hypothetical protein